MLTPYRRHKAACPHFDKGRAHRNCKCCIWTDGILDGKELRQSLKTRNWTKANQMVQQMEASQSAIQSGAPVTLDGAWASIHVDFVSRNLASETIRKYKQLEKQMKAFAKVDGLNLLKQFDLDTLGRFRASWKDGPLAASKKIERLRSFFRFAVDREWVKSNPASKMKLPKVSDAPTMPFTSEEMTSIYKACDTLVESRRKQDKMNAYRVKPLILVMRYAGLRVSDAVALTTDQIDRDSIVIRHTKKTHVPVRLRVPNHVLVELAKTPKQTKTRFFWAGNGTREHAAEYWRSVIKEVFDLAGIEKGESNMMSHRLRDTFAVELLQANTPIERVSKLLGHKSVAITEKHYSPWNKARQLQAEADVVRSWENDPLLHPEIEGTKKVQEISVLPS